MVIREIRKLFSKDVIFSLFTDFDFDAQTTRSKNALFALVPFTIHVVAVLRTAPYLFLIYFLVTWINLQYQILGVTVAPTTATVTSGIALVLLVISNALAYIETTNVHSNRIIEHPGKHAVKSVFRLFRVFTVTSFLIIFGFFMFVIPGVYLALRLCVTSPICVIEQTGVRDTISRSLAVTKKQHTFISTVFTGLTVLFIPFIALLGVTTGQNAAIVILAFSTVIPPIMHIGLAVIYLNGVEDSPVSLMPANKK